MVIKIWASAHLQIFQRHDDPLNCAWIRQYFYEGMERWKLQRISAILPASGQVIALLVSTIASHFFNVNIAIVAIVTTAAIIILTWYIWFTIARVHNPQSPYQSSLSEFIWPVFQLIYGWT
ncbi:hypothetical protein V8E53_002597 [Lactarius tabidus]|jgi:hypothetical protein